MTEKNIQPQQLTLYYSPYCPYCHRVLNALVDLGLSVDLDSQTASGLSLKDTFADREAKSELKNGGGRTTVPCLRIQQDNDVEWLYESLDIIKYLQTRLVV